MDVRRHIWEGAIPLQLQLHQSEITTLPSPSPLIIMAPRNGYLPLLADIIRPQFQSALPPGDEALWFDFKGLPLKWNIPTGVLFDMLCVEPERPWNLTVHFRMYPKELLIPYEGIEAAKWNYMNSLKEASYIMHGHTKSVTNLSKADENGLWESIVADDMEEHDRIAFKLGHTVAGCNRIPMRLYVRVIEGEDTFSLPPIRSWDEVTTMTRPVEIRIQEEGEVYTIGDALFRIIPKYFVNGESKESYESGLEFNGIVKIQGICVSLDLPMNWIFKSLSAHEQFIHVCIWCSSS